MTRYRSRMTAAQKCDFITTHGEEAFLALPWEPPAKFNAVQSLDQLVPETVKREFVAERGLTEWDKLVARARRPW